MFSLLVWDRDYYTFEIWIWTLCLPCISQYRVNTSEAMVSIQNSHHPHLQNNKDENITLFIIQQYPPLKWLLTLRVVSTVCAFNVFVTGNFYIRATFLIGLTQGCILFQADGYGYINTTSVSSFSTASPTAFWACCPFPPLSPLIRSSAISGRCILNFNRKETESFVKLQEIWYMKYVKNS